MTRPTIAFFDLASCEGCQLQIANLGEQLFDILDLIELVEFREIMSETWQASYDIAMVEGSVINREAEQRLREIRRRSTLLIAYGSCAAIGGINAIRNLHPSAEAQRSVYCHHPDWFEVAPVQALHRLVKVDYTIPGCPIFPPEFIKVLNQALTGLPSPVPDHAVCVECRFNENVCLYEKGITCLGPVTRAGCNSWCVNHGNLCYGCRGLVSNPNQAGAEDVLRRYNLNAELIANRMTLYNAEAEH